jgi:hypothetical protein
MDDLPSDSNPHPRPLPPQDDEIDQVENLVDQFLQNFQNQHHHHFHQGQQNHNQQQDEEGQQDQEQGGEEDEEGEQDPWEALVAQGQNNEGWLA